MRVLLTIPHYYTASAVPSTMSHGSQRAAPTARIRALDVCIASLHETFGTHQGMFNLSDNLVLRFNRPSAMEVDIVVCVHEDKHQLSPLQIPSSLYRRHQVSVPPIQIGFECHDVLQSNLGNYDYYGYLEDDIHLTDPLFFTKLAWFNQLAGNECLLQPQRFEASIMHPIHKLYVDCKLIDPSISGRFQDRFDRPRLEFDALGRRMVFERIDNPHSGCFFLNAAQMEHWAKQPWFLDRDIGFWGPLESAATLGITRTFRVYKPAKENASFLEVRHLDNRYLGRLIRVSEEMLEP
jgi:hypothetical protein